MTQRSQPAIGIDVGGTKIAGAVVAADGAILARNQVPTEASSERAVLTAIVKLALELRAVAPAACAIGVGAAGLVDVPRGVVVGAPNLAYRDMPVRDQVQAKLGLPVFVDNDANAAAWGEAQFGAGRSAGDQLMLTVGTGIGGGLIIGGDVYRGGNGFGAEIGHLIVAPDGPLCACGVHGCVEVLASGTAIGRIAREGVEAGEGTLGVDSDAIDAEAVVAAAKNGEEFALGVLRQAGHFLGIAIASMINVLDPQIVIVGGGAGEGAGELLLAPARQTVDRFVTLRALRTAAPIVLATLGNDAGAIGAADLARRNI